MNIPLYIGYVGSFIIIIKAITVKKKHRFLYINY